MKDEVLSRLANIAIVQTNVLRVLGIVRGVISREKLQALQNRSRTLDVEFVDLFLAANENKQDDIDIAEKVKQAKAALAGQKNLKTSVEAVDGGVVVNAPEDESELPEHVKKTAKKKAKKTTRKAKVNAKNQEE